MAFDAIATAAFRMDASLASAFMCMAAAAAYACERRMVVLLLPLLSPTRASVAPCSVHSLPPFSRHNLLIIESSI